MTWHDRDAERPWDILRAVIGMAVVLLAILVWGTFAALLALE
jgi:hypothetical protein